MLTMFRTKGKKIQHAATPDIIFARKTDIKQTMKIEAFQVKFVIPFPQLDVTNSFRVLVRTAVFNAIPPPKNKNI